jgi:hypothetical protein
VNGPPFLLRTMCASSRRRTGAGVTGIVSAR